MLKRWPKIVNYFQITGKVYIGVIASLSIACGMSYVFPQILLSDNKADFITFLALLFFASSFFFPAYFIFNFIKSSFSGQGSLNRLIVVTHAYLGVIIVFAALFFNFNIIGDFWNQVNAYQYYSKTAVSRTYGSGKFPIYKITEQRAFKGFSTNLWVGATNPDFELLCELGGADVDEGFCYRCAFNDYVEGKIAEVPPELSFNLSKLNLPWSKRYKFQKQYLYSNFGECLYLSVITIATVGYGDISPQSWYAKLAVALEVMVGLIIFVFAVNFLFLNWAKEQTNKGN